MPDRELLLLRHGEIESHRGDVPLTRKGIESSRRAGEAIARSYAVPVRILASSLLRSRQTAAELAAGIAAAGGEVTGPFDDEALRNPDLYVAGQRVNMVSSAESLAGQVAGLDAAACGRLPFWRDFLTDADRVGYWLGHPDPPGDDARAVARRILSGFAPTLFDAPASQRRLVIGVSHSPVLRACALAALGDPGEMPNLSGLRITADPAGTIAVAPAGLLVAGTGRARGSADHGAL